MFPLPKYINSEFLAKRGSDFHVRLPINGYDRSMAKKVLSLLSIRRT